MVHFLDSIRNRVLSANDLERNERLLRFNKRKEQYHESINMKHSLDATFDKTIKESKKSSAKFKEPENYAEDFNLD